MEQRTLRLGDVVDDYCPRERRITNHAIVAIVENSIRKTRCSTCDSEHVYKHGKTPRRRKSASAEDLAGGQLVAPRAAESGSPEPDEPAAESEAAVASAAAELESGAGLQAAAEVDEPAPVPDVVTAAAADDEEPAEDPQADEQPEEAWGTHRRLIRATLPRTEGEPPPQRPIPEFTMHQRQSRGGQRSGQGWQGSNGQGRGRSGNANGNTNGNTNGNSNNSSSANGNGNSKGSGRGRGRSGRNRGHKRSR